MTVKTKGGIGLALIILGIFTLGIGLLFFPSSSLATVDQENKRKRNQFLVVITGIILGVIGLSFYRKYVPSF